MNILLLGSGGREHALAWKLSQSSLCKKLYIAPGNGGTLIHGKNIQLAADDLEGIAQFSIDKNIDMVIPGPEAPLVAGIYDFFKNHDALAHIPVIGPSAEGARLEGSKSFAKSFMHRHNIPTASYRAFDVTHLQEGLRYLDNHTLPVVLKADGLAAGKGVLICTSHEEAKSRFSDMLNGKFGGAGSKVVIEEFLDGREVSIFVLSDGEHYKILPPAKDYKRAFENDEGPNTGGMGAVSPVPFIDHDFLLKIIDQIIEPTINGLKKDGIIYKGIIYFGLMAVNKKSYVIEYNCRFGDPEAQVLIPRIESDLLDIFLHIHRGTLNEKYIRLDPRSCSTIVAASGGYPGTYEKGKLIEGIDKVDDSIVFQAGTRIDESGNLLTNGGRVLTVTSLNNKLSTAIDTSLKNIKKIHFESKFFRKDIGQDILS